MLGKDRAGVGACSVAQSKLRWRRGDQLLLRKTACLILHSLASISSIVSYVHLECVFIVVHRRSTVRVVTANLLMATNRKRES